MIQKEEYKDEKRKRKTALKERKKLSDRLNLKMIVKNDAGPTVEADDLFSLKLLKSNKDLSTIIDQDPNQLAESDDEKEEKPKKKYDRYSKDEDHLDSKGLYYKDSDSELEMESDDQTGDAPEGLGKDNDSGGRTIL